MCLIYLQINMSMLNEYVVKHNIINKFSLSLFLYIYIYIYKFNISFKNVYKKIFNIKHLILHIS